MPPRFTALMLSSLGALALFTCTYRTDMLASLPAGSGGAAGTTATGGITSTGGTTATGGSTAEDGACTTDADCLQCVYATAPSDTDACEHALGCCGGPVMNKATCARNEAAWQAHCANRGYTAPMCPCIVCGGSITCQAGRCGYWDC